VSLQLYGIVAADGLAEEDYADLVLIRSGGLAAVASVCEHADQEVEAVLGFGNIIERIHQHTTIIPLRYGTMLPDAEAVAGHLSAMAGYYRERLAELAGCAEMGVRLPMSKPFNDNTAIPPATTGRAYLQALKRKYSASEQAECEAAALNEALAGLYRQQRGEAGLFNGEHMYLVSYLVERGSLPAFRDRLEALSASGKLKGLISGPWPPYNFA
jgi:hypothetical protein